MEREAQVLAGLADRQPISPWNGDKAAAEVRLEVASGEFHPHHFRLARLQGGPSEGPQLHRWLARAVRVAQVGLDNRGPGPAAGIAHVHFYRGDRIVLSNRGT